MTKLTIKFSKVAVASLLLALSSQLASVFAQPTTFTYQGLVTDNGTNFTGTGQFKFALVTTSNAASQATATAHLTGAFVTSVTVNSGGNGYSTPPVVTFSGGGGSGAAAQGTATGTSAAPTATGQSSTPQSAAPPAPPLRGRQ